MWSAKKHAWSVPPTRSNWGVISGKHETSKAKDTGAGKNNFNVRKGHGQRQPGLNHLNRAQHGSFITMAILDSWALVPGGR